MTMNEIIETALNSIPKDYLYGFIEGRRNYVIVTYNDRFWALGFGEAKRYGLLRWSFKSMRENNIHFLHFTYKKDWKNAINVLTAAGMKMY